MTFSSSLSSLCKVFDVSRQAFYRRQKQRIEVLLQEELVMQLVLEKRTDLPKVGGKKLYHMLKEDLQAFKKSIGRDKFFDFLRKNDLLIKRRRSHARTTNSRHRFKKYMNLIKDLILSRSNQVWVCDITYLKTAQGFVYLALITDLYSRKIIGYDLSRSLTAAGSLRALRMALSQAKKGTKGIVHHSDRGVQYCCHAYVNLLKKHEIEISMTEENHIAENATAERVNGILKGEFDLDQVYPSFARARLAVVQSIRKYNEIRPHNSLNLRTPEEAHAA